MWNNDRESAGPAICREVLQQTRASPPEPVKKMPAPAHRWRAGSPRNTGTAYRAVDSKAPKPTDLQANPAD